MKKTDRIFAEDETYILSTNRNIKVERSLSTCARTRGTVTFSKGDVRSLMSSEIGAQRILHPPVMGISPLMAAGFAPGALAAGEGP